MKRRTLNYVIWGVDENSKICNYTTIENYHKLYMDAWKVKQFRGTIKECQKWIIENLEKGLWDD